jgi:hypothetical protein
MADNQNTRAYRSYEELIVEQYNKFANQYEAAVATSGMITEQGFAAFMCNAIAARVVKSSRQDIKDYFYKHASRE